MIKLQKISIFELSESVKISYEGDEDLLNKYHIEKFNLEDAVESTMSMISETDEAIEMSFYKVVKDGVGIGYLATFQNFLYSFGISIKYRTKEVLLQYWELIKEVLDDGFITMLYPNNDRAINFLKRQGMVEVEGVQGGLITLIYNKSN